MPESSPSPRPSPGPGAVAGTGVGERSTVVIVGGGIAGMAAAWELTGAASGPRPGAPAVVVLEGSERLGGKLRSQSFAGRVVDVGPDGFLGRRPEGEQLCREIGLGDALAPIGASGASVWAGGRLRPLPSGLNLGVPTRYLPVARSGVLGAAGNARLLADVLAPRPDRRGPLGDRAVGPLVARKLGRRVVDRLVDPLLGGIYAGGVADVSAAAVHPLLLTASRRQGSFMRSLRRAAAETAGVDRVGSPHGEPPPAFWALRGGLGVLADRLAGALAGRGVALRTGCAVQRLERADGGAGGWVVHTSTGPIAADGIVLAAPAGPAAALIAPHDAEAANLLRSVDYASVAVVTLALPEGALPDDLGGTGLLVPRSSRLPGATAAGLADAGLLAGEDGSGHFVVTACTFLSQKWPHLARPGGSLLRASVGRAGDERHRAMDDTGLGRRVAVELGTLLGTDLRPEAVLVTRWPDALPQYRVHHLLRVAGVQAALRRLPAVTVAGAAYHGVGIPACIASGRTAAQVLQRRMGASVDAP
ncbi:MAG: protoporphyrinogen oxidase [Acidimicrobiales bacterium]